MFAKSLAFAFLAVLLASAVVPMAAAQQTQTTIKSVTPPPTPIAPEIANPKITVVASYQIENPATNPITQVTPNLKVDFIFNCPAYVVITGPSAVVIPVNTANTNQYDATYNGNIAVKRTAPGLEQIRCTVKAQSATIGSGQLAGSTSGDTPFSVSADYYSLLQATVSKQLQQSGPYKNVPFQMDITNFGNARTRVDFELISEPNGGKWNAILPTQLVLESPNTGLTPTQGTATMTVSTTYKNGWNNEQGGYTVKIKSVAADAPDKVGSELQTNFLVRVRGVYVPSLEPTLMVGALLGTALILRLRKEE